MTPTRSEHWLVFEHLTKSYGKRTVVDELTFKVAPGRVTGFLGPNGSGKTTTMKILLGLADADHGRATIGGVRYCDLDRPADIVGAMLEPDAFHPGRSGRDHLAIVARAAGHPLTAIDRTLDHVGLDDVAARRRVGTYSLGMKQRLSLAVALLGDPEVLVLDEPANGLDPQGIRDLRQLLRDRAARGQTVLVSSHLLTELEHLVDDVVVINHGRLVTSGTISALTERRATVRTPDPERLVRTLATMPCEVQLTEPDSLVVSGLELDQIGEAAHGADVVLHELSSHAGSLEDVFLSLTAPTQTPAPTHLEADRT